MSKSGNIQWFIFKKFLLFSLFVQASKPNDLTMFYRVLTSSKLAKRLVVPIAVLGLNLYVLTKAEQFIAKVDKKLESLAFKLKELCCQRRGLTQDYFDKKNKQLSQAMLSCQNSIALSRFLKFVCRLIAPFLWMLIFATLLNWMIFYDLSIVQKAQQDLFQSATEARLDGISRSLAVLSRAQEETNQAITDLMLLQSSRGAGYDQQVECGPRSIRRNSW